MSDKLSREQLLEEMIISIEQTAGPSEIIRILRILWPNETVTFDGFMYTVTEN